MSRFDRLGCWAQALIFLSVTVIAPLACWYVWHPGGSLNKHDWLSEHANGFTYTPLYLEVSDIRTGHEHATEGWCIDFCAKHSEVRVAKSPCSKSLPNRLWFNDSRANSK